MSEYCECLVKSWLAATSNVLHLSWLFVSFLQLFICCSDMLSPCQVPSSCLLPVFSQFLDLVLVQLVNWPQIIWPVTNWGCLVRSFLAAAWIVLHHSWLDVSFSNCSYVAALFLALLNNTKYLSLSLSTIIPRFTFRCVKFLPPRSRPWTGSRLSFGPTYNWTQIIWPVCNVSVWLNLAFQQPQMCCTFLGCSLLFSNCLYVVRICCLSVNFPPASRL